MEYVYLHFLVDFFYGKIGGKYAIFPMDPKKGSFKQPSRKTKDPESSNGRKRLLKVLGIKAKVFSGASGDSLETKNHRKNQGFQ